MRFCRPLVPLFPSLLSPLWKDTVRRNTDANIFIVLDSVLFLTVPWSPRIALVTRRLLWVLLLLFRKPLCTAHACLFSPSFFRSLYFYIEYMMIPPTLSSLSFLTLHLIWHPNAFCAFISARRHWYLWELVWRLGGSWSLCVDEFWCPYWIPPFFFFF